MKKLIETLLYKGYWDEVEFDLKLIPNERELDILQRYYVDRETLASIGKSMNISGPRVRQLRDKALSKIRHGIFDGDQKISEYVQEKYGHI